MHVSHLSMSSSPNYPFVYFQKIAKKAYGSFFFGTMNDGDAHSDSCCCSSTPSLHSLYISLMRTSLCIFGTGNARPWYGFTPSFNWKETGVVFQSPKVPSKRDSYFMRSCSNLFCWSALRCLQLSLTIDWRSALLYLASSIRTARLVVSFVLIGSLAKLLFSFSDRSILCLCRLLMFLIGKVTSSTVIVLALKSNTIPNSFMVSVPRMRSYCGLLFFSYLTTSGSA